MDPNSRNQQRSREQAAGRRDPDWGQIALFAATRVLFNTMYRMVYPFLPVFGRGLGVSLRALSLAVTFRSVTGCFGPFLATLADSMGRKAGMMLGLILFVCGTGVVRLLPGFRAFAVCLVLTIIGKYVFDPSIQAHLGDRVPYEKRGVVIALSELGWSLSFIAGVPLAAALIASRGWLGPFAPMAVAGLAALGLYAWRVPRDRTRRQRYLGMGTSFRLILTCAPALMGLGIGLLATTANEVINLIFGVWMEESFGLKIAGLGAASALVGLSELGGELLVVALTDRVGKRRAVGIGLLMNSAAALALPFIGSRLAGAMVGLSFFYLTFEFAMVSLIPLMTEIMPDARATLLAVNVAALSLGRALGALAASRLYGLGIRACGGAALAFNLAAFSLVRRIPGIAHR